MTELSNVSPSPSAASDAARGLRYLALAVLANAALWSVAFLLMKDAPKVFSSQWSVIFLGRGTQASVSLPNIGSASAQAESPFNRDNDVKASYKEIMSTDVVRKSAADKLGLSPSQFGKPRIEVVEGTALMNFDIAGATPEQAQKKAYAVHEAFQERLNQLRVQQAAEQEAGFENSLSVARKKLETAQLRLSDYKVRSGLASNDQVNQLASNIEGLRRQRAEVAALQQESVTQAQQYSRNLNVSSRLAGDAFALRADPLFQQYVQDYSEATARLTDISSKFGPNHPAVVKEVERRTATQAALQSRAQSLLGRPADTTSLARINVGGGSAQGTAREDLFKSVVTSDVEQRGLAARAQELDRQMAGLEQRLGVLAQRSSTLEALNRDMQIAEAVFSSTLAGLDASKADVFGAYPPIQLVSEPSLPGDPLIPQRESMLLGTALGSVLITTGLFSMWLRKTGFARNLLRRRNAPSTV
ncbi:hypothetical protein H6F43_10630 [Leptolyngbya sp. FACHB-36]|uniref:GumC family protein n=1 Tax=Leptolyngbya sp. FACHB-36 TaxID=2692808 RepID=UPI0016812A25|nr:hypothetical protein [Leptolyngbya sp. FACHB-36]MBD2020637.1 hypothetical protein [Leptolyngbya sp. FACHB-36]